MIGRLTPATLARVILYWTGCALGALGLWGIAQAIVDARVRRLVADRDRYISAEGAGLDVELADFLRKRR